MLNSVMAHVKAAIDGLVFPTGLTFNGTTQVPDLKAHITTPYGYTVSDRPHAFIWGGTLNEKRRTMGGPRAATVNTSSPFHTLNHRIDIIVRYALPLKLVNIDSCFPAILDSIMEVLRGIEMPVKITDALTGRQSTIQIIGEEFDVQYPQLYNLQDGRYALFGAKITMPVKEEIQQ